MNWRLLSPKNGAFSNGYSGIGQKKPSIGLPTQRRIRQCAAQFSKKGQNGARRNREGVNVLGGGCPRIFKHTAFIADVQQVGVGAVRFLVGGGHFNAMFAGKGHQGGARGQVPFTPGRDDFDVRFVCQIPQFEAHLVVSLAGGAMADGIRLLELGNFDLPFGDQRTGQRGAEQILPLIDGICTEGRKDIISDKIFL